MEPVQQQPPDVMRAHFEQSFNFEIASKETQGKSYVFHKVSLFSWFFNFD